MLMPSIFGENLFDEFFGDWDREMRRMDRQLYGKNAAREMKTDVHEHEDHYEVDIDLPGFKKEDITLELQNGYLTVTASKGLDMGRYDAEELLCGRYPYGGGHRRKAGAWRAEPEHPQEGRKEAS